MKQATAMLAALTLAACSPRPDAISPVIVPGKYADLTCPQLQAAMDQALQQRADLYQQQNSAATADAIGVFFVAVPVSNISGGNKAGQVAVSKGDVLQLQSALERCR